MFKDSDFLCTTVSPGRKMLPKGLVDEKFHWPKQFFLLFLKILRATLGDLLHKNQGFPVASWPDVKHF